MGGSFRVVSRCDFAVIFWEIPGISGKLKETAGKSRAYTMVYFLLI